MESDNTQREAFDENFQCEEPQVEHIFMDENKTRDHEAQLDVFFEKSEEQQLQHILEVVTSDLGCANIGECSNIQSNSSSILESTTHNMYGKHDPSSMLENNAIMYNKHDSSHMLDTIPTILNQPNPHPLTVPPVTIQQQSSTCLPSSTCTLGSTSSAHNSEMLADNIIMDEFNLSTSLPYNPHQLPPQFCQKIMSTINGANTTNLPFFSLPQYGDIEVPYSQETSNPLVPWYQQTKLEDISWDTPLCNGKLECHIPYVPNLNLLTNNNHPIIGHNLFQGSQVHESSTSSTSEVLSQPCKFMHLPFGRYTTPTLPNSYNLVERFPTAGSLQPLNIHDGVGQYDTFQQKCHSEDIVNKDDFKNYQCFANGLVLPSMDGVSSCDSNALEMDTSSSTYHSKEVQSLHVDMLNDPQPHGTGIPQVEFQPYPIEERKKRIERFMKKRQKRNFSKTIKYACRKTLADNRPRIKGRFAKTEESEHLQGFMN